MHNSLEEEGYLVQDSDPSQPDFISASQMEEGHCSYLQAQVFVRPLSCDVTELHGICAVSNVDSTVLSRVWQYANKT
ncbi:hypothetical protein TNCV_1955061 [Trichonephila clavipes]|nr:hypothetical protein TNCV_1955061 [Trichonephila clavipes]